MRILDKESRQLINKARNLGGKGPTVYLEDIELLRLCMITAIDLDQLHLISSILSDEDLSISYYRLPLTWFEKPISANVDFVEIFLVFKEHLAEYAKFGGSAYIGNDAWKHVEDRAGLVMGKFVEKYVRVPLREVDRSYNHLLPIHLISTASEITTEIGHQTFTISRARTTMDYEGISEIDLDDES